VVLLKDHHGLAHLRSPLLLLGSGGRLDGRWLRRPGNFFDCSYHRGRGRGRDRLCNLE
jgi:hypothetical protein